MQPSRKRDGKPVGEGDPGHSWDAAIAQARWEIRWGGRPGAQLGCSHRASAMGNPLGRARRGTVGMQPSRKRDGKSAGEGRGARLGCSHRASAMGSPLGRAGRLSAMDCAMERGRPSRLRWRAWRSGQGRKTSRPPAPNVNLPRDSLFGAGRRPDCFHCKPRRGAAARSKAGLDGDFNRFFLSWLQRVRLWKAWMRCA
jgi:hypothetical protein